MSRFDGKMPAIREQPLRGDGVGLDSCLKPCRQRRYRRNASRKHASILNVRRWCPRRSCGCRRRRLRLSLRCGLGLVLSLGPCLRLGCDLDGAVKTVFCPVTRRSHRKWHPRSQSLTYLRSQPRSESRSQLYLQVAAPSFANIAKTDVFEDALIANKRASNQN